MYESPLLARLRPSATVAVTQKARALRDDGRDVLVISGGEPDFDTPDHIKRAAIEAIQGSAIKYTPTAGIPALKAAVARKFERDNGLSYAPDEIMVGTGGKQIIFNALVATVSPGDEVVVPVPYWVSYADIVDMAAGKTMFVDCAEENGFKITAEQLRSAITPATRWFVINSPSNPTGAVYSHEELRALADVLLDNPHVLVLSDDIYEHIVFDGRSFATLAAVEPALKPRTLVVNGVSKGFCMTGWRIGFGAGPDWLIRSMTRLQGQTTTSTSAVSQFAAVAALDGPKDFIPAHNAVYQQRRDNLVRTINQIEGLSTSTPEGAFYVYVNVAPLIGRTLPDSRVIRSDLDVAEHLLVAGGVAVVPGTGFGKSPYFRLCFAYSDETMSDACDRIRAAVRQLS